MRLKVVACGVFEPELRTLAQETANDVDLCILDAGLHSRPWDLHDRAQEAIDTAADCDAIAIVYGLCGRGIHGLAARHVPLVLPKAHDCMTLFLGSRAAYGEQFKAHPGTIYVTPGWFEHSIAPRQEKHDRLLRSPEEVEKHPRFAELAAQHGADNARVILNFQESWKRNYTRIAFIDTGCGDTDRYVAYSQKAAEALGWQLERIEGDVHVIRALLDGDWDRGDILVVQPGQRCIAVGGDEIIDAVDIAPDREQSRVAAVCGAGKPFRQAQGGEQRRTAARETPERPRVSTKSATDQEVVPHDSGPRKPFATRNILPDEPLVIGIDAGGTYTDSIIATQRDVVVLSKAKAPTTPRDLLIGIRASVAQLDWPDPKRIRSVCLSTTLATNAIAENKGGMPGLVFMPGVSGAEIDWPLVRAVPGCMTVSGEEYEPLDRETTARALDELIAAGADAVAIVGYGSVRNPAHENALREMARARCDLPIVCGHDLSLKLNVIDRAHTALLNARLFPPIAELIEATRRMMRDFGVDATLWVVKGDGSLMNEATARRRPIDTLLSGPAASVSGALHLSNAADALVIDMGGTTTDAAIVENGVVRLQDDGVRANGWRLHVVAADISTVGLGGDSRVDFTAHRELTLGPDRAIPLCCTAAEHPEIRRELKELTARHLDHKRSARELTYLCLRRDPAAPLSGRNAAIVEALRERPLRWSALARRVGLVSGELLRTHELEARGLVIRSTLTPTDILHVMGDFNAWDSSASREALRVFAELHGDTAGRIAECVMDMVVRKLCEQAIRRQTGFDLASRGSRQILDEALREGSRSDVTFHVRCRRPIIGIGAPVHSFFPAVGRRLNAEVILPTHAEVANAIGAAASGVLVNETVTILPDTTGSYLLHSKEGRREFGKLAPAIEEAKALARRLAEERARASGATSCNTLVNVDTHTSVTADGGDVFVQAVVEATAKGSFLDEG